jgi:hypothetical protein
VVELIVVALAGALHEPCVDFGAELDVSHGVVELSGVDDEGMEGSLEAACRVGI